MSLIRWPISNSTPPVLKASYRSWVRWGGFRQNTPQCDSSSLTSSQHLPSLLVRRRCSWWNTRRCSRCSSATRPEAGRLLTWHGCDGHKAWYRISCILSPRCSSISPTLCIQIILWDSEEPNTKWILIILGMLSEVVFWFHGTVSVLCVGVS